ncbi:MAG: hypothetical protein AAF533_18830 [Acidobacteriota bacterium]
MNEGTERLQARAAKHLRWLSPDSVGPLHEAITNSPDVTVRTTAMAALARSGHRRARDLLLIELESPRRAGEPMPIQVDELRQLFHCLRGLPQPGTPPETLSRLFDEPPDDVHLLFEAVSLLAHCWSCPSELVTRAREACRRRPHLKTRWALDALGVAERHWEAGGAPPISRFLMPPREKPPGPSTAGSSMSESPVASEEDVWWRPPSHPLTPEERMKELLEVLEGRTPVESVAAVMEELLLLHERLRPFRRSQVMLKLGPFFKELFGRFQPNDHEREKQDALARGMRRLYQGEPLATLLLERVIRPGELSPRGVEAVARRVLLPDIVQSADDALAGVLSHVARQLTLWPTGRSHVRRPDAEHEQALCDLFRYLHERGGGSPERLLGFQWLFDEHYRLVMTSGPLTRERLVRFRQDLGRSSVTDSTRVQLLETCVDLAMSAASPEDLRLEALTTAKVAYWCLAFDERS